MRSALRMLSRSIANSDGVRGFERLSLRRGRKLESKMRSIPTDSSDHHEVVPIRRVVIQLGTAPLNPAYAHENSLSDLSRVGYGILHIDDPLLRMMSNL